MDKRIRIGSFFDGFNDSEIDCVHKQYAAAISNIDESFYYYYGMIYVTYMNWGMNNKNNIEYRITKELGVEIDAIEASDVVNLVNSIKKYVSEGYPIVLRNTLNSMYYYQSCYRKSVNIYHAIVIKEWNENQQLFTIMDYCQNDSVIGEICSNQPIMEIVIPYDRMIEIASISYQTIKEMPLVIKFSNFSNCVVKRETILKHIIKTISCENNTLAWFIQISDKLFNIEEFRLVRECYYGGIKVLFKAIEKLYGELLQDCYYEIKEEYLESRDKALFSIHHAFFHRRGISEKLQQKLIGVLEGQDRKLLDYLRIIESKIIEKQSFKLQYPMEIFSDSEFKYNNRVISRYNIIKPRNDDWENGAWISDNNRRQHWLQYNYQDDIIIDKIIIKHDSRISLRTIAYSISTSLDGENWNTIYRERINNLSMNELYFDSIRARFVKIEVRKPSSEDSIARLYEFSIYKNSI